MLRLLDAKIFRGDVSAKLEVRSAVPLENFPLTLGVMRDEWFE
jgi:hypothetical protein